ncbi:MAG: IS21-like element helper ATPase IstB [Candidatus Thiodiazotropha sp. (ex Dulcina madagascariensis)]|nr:IS21-like element helper ATPase IstB [Candidatus Thiodiazotropha sp. (ex Dulcina madagascariensis)]
MNPMPELSPMLKQLRLSGILDSLETRNRQAIENKLTYPEFLALLIQDEVARREQRKLNTRLRRANFRSQKTLEQFDFDFNPKINQALIQELASCRFIEEKVAVLIVGPCGTGKSHLAQALGHSAARQGFDVMFTTQSQLLGNLHAARATDTFERRFQAIARIPLLIIDDFGLKPLRSPHDEDLHDLVAERYERGSTVVTSNLDFSEWGDAFPNRLLGAATLDRRRHAAYRVVLDGDSYRAPRPMPKAPKSTVAGKAKNAQS